MVELQEEEEEEEMPRLVARAETPATSMTMAARLCPGLLDALLPSPPFFAATDAHSSSSSSSPAVPEPSLSETIQASPQTPGLRPAPSPVRGCRAPVPPDLYRFHQQQYHLVEDPAFSSPAGTSVCVCVFEISPLEHLKKDGIAAEDPRKVHISFNVSSVPQDERLVSAELRLLWNPRVSMGSGAHKLSLYLSENEDRTGPGTDLLETRLFSAGLRGDAEGSWETFSLDAELLRQALAERGSLGFVLEIGAENSTRPGYSSAVEPEEPERSGEGHLRVRRSLGQDEYSWAQERPLLVTYSHDGRMGWGDRGRVKRNGGRAAKLKRLSRARCRRHPLYVDFKDVGWHKWIIAPSGRATGASVSRRGLRFASPSLGRPSPCLLRQGPAHPQVSFSGPLRLLRLHGGGIARPGAVLRADLQDEAQTAPLRQGLPQELSVKAECFPGALCVPTEASGEQPCFQQIGTRAKRYRLSLWAPEPIETLGFQRSRSSAETSLSSWGTEDTLKEMCTFLGSSAAMPSFLSMMKAAYGVGLLHVPAGEAEGRVLHQVVLLLVEAVQIQEVLGHGHPRTGLGLGLQAQAFEEKPLDGLGQAGLRDRGGRRRKRRSGRAISEKLQPPAFPPSGKPIGPGRSTRLPSNGGGHHRLETQAGRGEWEAPCPADDSPAPRRRLTPIAAREGAVGGEGEEDVQETAKPRRRMADGYLKNWGSNPPNSSTSGRRTPSPRHCPALP
ncbi:hypothetical protein CRUP_024612 [Coryphaenoides rupestris]|nr:hypothetical protein CRUP_024612 [Coryphaenoides rupestris]